MELKFSSDVPVAGHPQTIQIIDEFLELDRVASAYGYFKAFPRIASSGEFWFDVRAIQSNQEKWPESIGLRDYFGACDDFLVAHFAQLLHILPSESLRQARVLELWFSIQREVSTSDVVYLHTDSNHTTDGWTNNVRVPIWGSVFHLGPGSGIIGGETCFCTERPIPGQMLDQLHESIPCHEARRLSGEWVDIPQKQNRLIVFNGSLPHYAAPLRGLNSLNEPRVSLLVNVWDHLPIARSKLNGCSTMSPPEFLALRKLRESQLDQLEEIINQLSPMEIDEAIKFLIRTRLGAP